MSKGAILIAAILLVFLGLAVWLMFAGWNIAGDVEMSGQAIAAMIGGIIFSLLVGCGLMFLVFYSSRSGYDEPGRLMKDEE
jgi:hypothetical protein